MSLAISADGFFSESDSPAPRKGILSRVFNAAVKAAPTAAIGAALGFTLRTTALSGAVFAGASTGVTLAAVAAASGTTAALMTAGKEVWTGRKDGRGILETLSSRDVLKKVRNNFAIAAGFGALGGAVAPLVLDYVKGIDFGAMGEKVANFFLPVAAAYDHNPGDMVTPGRSVEAPLPPAAKPSAPLVADAGTPAPKASVPAAEPSAPANGKSGDIAPPAEPAPKQQPPAAPSRRNPLDSARTLIAAQPGAKGAEALAARLESMTPQQLKDEGVRALWGQGSMRRNPELARALFEAARNAGNTQALDALAFMNEHNLGISKGNAPTAIADAPAKSPLSRPGIVARCTLTRPAMEGLTLDCKVRTATMLPGDRVDVTDKSGRLFQIFYDATDKVRSAAHAISTGSFLSGRVGPVMMAADPELRALVERHKISVPKLAAK